MIKKKAKKATKKKVWQFRTFHFELNPSIHLANGESDTRASLPTSAWHRVPYNSILYNRRSQLLKTLFSLHNGGRGADEDLIGPVIRE